MDAEGWGTSTSPGQEGPKFRRGKAQVPWRGCRRVGHIYEPRASKAPSKRKRGKAQGPWLGCRRVGHIYEPRARRPQTNTKGVGPKSPGLDAKGWGFYPSPGQGRPNGSNPPDLSHDPWAGSNRGGPKVGVCTQRAAMCAQGGEKIQNQNCLTQPRSFPFAV